MLTRLKVDGFKNLIDVDVAFGPYTCIAGSNGAGKSNLFDAIEFLSLLARGTFAEAVAGTRSDDLGGSSVTDLLSRNGEWTAPSLRLECELLVPRTGGDDLGRSLEPASTYLRYAVELRRRGEGRIAAGPLELVREELVSVASAEARERLAFAAPDSAWVESVLLVEDEPRWFLSTVGDDDGPRAVMIHPDPKAERGVALGAGKGTVMTRDLSRSVLSSMASVYNPTLWLARQELGSWRRLELESRAMRRPDRFDAPVGIERDGSGMARTLHALIGSDRGGEGRPVLADLEGRLFEVAAEIRSLKLDVDDRRELLTLLGVDRHGTSHDARSLSEGTLRFLALAMLEADVRPGVLCLEEPENGIHPSRIESTVRLLGDIALDPGFADGEDNPLRQVVVNTHSPGVVSASSADALLFVDTRQVRVGGEGGRHVPAARFRSLDGTWRSVSARAGSHLSPPDLYAFLGYAPWFESERTGVANVRDYLAEWSRAVRF